MLLDLEPDSVPLFGFTMDELCHIREIFDDCSVVESLDTMGKCHPEQEVTLVNLQYCQLPTCDGSPDIRQLCARRLSWNACCCCTVLKHCGVAESGGGTTCREEYLGPRRMAVHSSSINFW